MDVIDWSEWCAKHHIKLKGSDGQHDNRQDARASDQRISGSVLEEKSPVYGRPPGDRDLQNHD